MFEMLLAEPLSSYEFNPSVGPWVEVLVDCPGVDGLFTYRVPPELTVLPGDIVSVRFGAQITGGIVIREVPTLPTHLEPNQIRNLEEVIARGFFPGNYWFWLEQIAHYYCTPLITVIRTALPSGLFRHSQQRIRLNKHIIPVGAEAFCSPLGQRILELLQRKKEGDYSSEYLKRQIPGASRGLQELLKRGWVESYLELPKPPRPKQQKAVTLVVTNFPTDLTSQQREVLQILQRRGGEIWLTELLQMAKVSSSVVETLAKKECVVVEKREILRLSNEPEVESDRAKTLTFEQQQALDKINAIEGHALILLHGVTGSGKTEVYLQAIEPILKQQKSALVLVPEISLTPQLTDRFRARFGEKICVYHSGLSEGERYDTWRQMLTGEAQVVIGARSAIFSPLPKLGLIILDEEHDSSFKQDSPMPTYHARKIAQWRAELNLCPLILGSATPSVDTWLEVEKENYLELRDRVQSRPFSPIKIIDMRQELKQGNRSIFSETLQNALHHIQQQQQQGILFVPRRGYSTFVSCRSCGYVIECPHCDLSLSYHYTHEGAKQVLRCHYCNHLQMHPPVCPQCESPFLKFFGSGTQKVTQELSKLFPELRFLRFDSDTTRNKGSHRTILTQFARGEVDVLVGTQMLTKGLDLAQVTLVGVVAADGLLNLADYRASERAFQTLTQVAGRAGRGDEPGQVIIQTYTPDHPVIHAVQNHNYHGFVQEILATRQSLNYPPYCRLILLRLSGLDAEDVERTTALVAEGCHALIKQPFELLGPAPARIMRINDRYRWMILLKFPVDENNIPSLSDLGKLCPNGVRLTIDVDPLNLD